MTPTDPAADALFDHLYLNGQSVAYQVEGVRTTAPDDRVLLAHATDLSARAPWAAADYAVVPDLPESLQQQMQAALAALLREAMGAAGCLVAPDFDVTHYHHVVGAACGQPVQAYNPHVGEAVFHLRIVRPNRADYNPLHRDAWLPRYQDALNIYLPVAGSTARSSLTLVPCSHHWPETDVERTAGGASTIACPTRCAACCGLPARSISFGPTPAPTKYWYFRPTCCTVPLPI